LVNKCRQHKDLESEDVRNCPECKDLLILTQKVKKLSDILEEENGTNQHKYNKLSDKEAEIALLQQKIALLEIESGEGADAEETASSKPRTEAELIEFLMANQIEGSLVPLIELPGVGNYLFGTRQIFVRVLENELVVRVGGGYMDINEFMVKFTDSELTKIQKQIKKEGVRRYEDIKPYQDLVVKNNLHPKNSQVVVPVLAKDEKINY